LERVLPGSLLRFVALAAPLLSVAFLAAAPDMHTYGGLSGLATGVVVLLALVQLRRAHPGRSWWFGALALVALKLAIDATQPAPLFASFGGQAVRASGFAHVLGALAAALFFLSRRSAAPAVLRRPAAGHPCR
jgi:hypothetical protein